MANINSAVQQYAAMSKESGAAYADPHQLILMLFDGALDRIAAAKGAILRSDVAEKGILISKAITIIDGLRAHLDHEKGGEISTNLKDLYDYMEMTLFNANLESDQAKLDEVAGLISEIREGWVGIADQVRNQSAVATSEENGSKSV